MHDFGVGRGGQHRPFQSSAIKKQLTKVSHTPKLLATTESEPAMPMHQDILPDCQQQVLARTGA